MFRWYFSHRFINDFAEQAIGQFVAAAPRVAEREARGKKKVARQAMATDRRVRQLMSSVLRFAKDERLNIFQRARLAQQLQNRLIKNGFSEELARGVAATVSQGP